MQLYTFKKRCRPSDQQQQIDLASKLAKFNVTLPDYYKNLTKEDTSKATVNHVALIDSN